MYGFHPAAVHPATAAYWLACLVTAGVALRSAPRPGRLLGVLAACLAAGAGTLWLVNLNRVVWGGHHAVGAWPFLLAALGFALRALLDAGRRRYVLAFLAVALRLPREAEWQLWVEE